MNSNIRKYGDNSITIITIHGGPGAPGEIAPIARELSKKYGVLEPLQTKDTIEGQYQELYTAIKENVDTPVYLIGHSWGAWLAYMFASRQPSMVKKIIMISSGPLEDKYAANLMDKRLSRLSEEEEYEVRYIEKLLSDRKYKNKKDAFQRFGELMTKADSFQSIKHNNEILEYQLDLSVKIGSEASQLRKNGKLLDMGYHINCPVVAIHGDYDSHPSEGVQIPLTMVLPDFRFILLNQCGHYPWYEEFAKEDFYEILFYELTK